MKYKNHKTKVDGIVFDSKREADRWLVLRILEETGEISNLRRQVKFVLVEGKRWSDGHKHRDITYIADFVYNDGGKTIVEDAKGFKTPVYIIKRELMKAVHNIEIVEV